jgi:hypothetical protein
MTSPVDKRKTPPPKDDPRRPMWQRIHTDMLCRNGRVEISKIAEIAGYVVIVCIMYRAWERLLDNPFALSLLVSCLLFPSIAKKIVGRAAK